MKNSRKTGAIFSYILIFVEMITSILFTPFIIKSLGSSEYGVYGLASSITSYLYLLDLGVGNAAVRYFAKYRFAHDRENEKKLLGITNIYYFAISLFILIIGFFIGFYSKNFFGKGLSTQELELLKSIIYISVINACLTLIFSSYKKVILAYEYFSLSKITDIIKVLSRVILCYIALTNGGKAFALVMVNLLLTILTGIVYVAFVLFKIRIVPSFKKFDFSFVKEVCGYSFFILLQMIASQLNLMVDRILIGTLVSEASLILAIYSVGSQIINYFESIGTAMNGLLMPGVVKMVESNADNKVLQKEITKVTRIVLTILLLLYIGFVAYGKSFINLWVGETYLSAYFVILIIMAPMILCLSESIGTQVLWAMNKHKKQAVLKFVVALTNIILTIFLIRIDPLIGSSIGTAIAILIGDVIVLNYIFIKDIGINIKQFYLDVFKGVVPVSFITLILAFLLSKIEIFKTNIVLFMVPCVITGIIYLSLMLLFGFNSYEKKLIFSLIKKRAK